MPLNKKEKMRLIVKHASKIPDTEKLKKLNECMYELKFYRRRHWRIKLNEAAFTGKI
ncbi:hypothetical protein [Butyrivibrio sp. AC2005]|uniref:hypothetical protein n=1 Tax=Butyrivibrio sp. AC2005 TaxID=1280672 RepID=UPI0003FF0E71|nr:hypothetical protein [Butyrivibrio sp. AC2005]